MGSIINKFLPILFACHQRPDRSFFYKGRQFPICARCTGVLIGYFAGIILSVIFRRFNFLLVIALALPLIIDGTLQRFTKYESKNSRRCLTGILFGIASVQIIVYIHVGTVHLAKMFLIAINS